MTITTAFYIYGTLIDPHGVTIALAPLVGICIVGKQNRVARNNKK